MYRESAGHLSTEALFKAPGDSRHDAPLTFYREPFVGGVPPWPPYEAQIKYHAPSRHTWDGQAREGRWKIQYRVPFLPAIPPTWRPPITPPPEPPPPTPPGEPPPTPPTVPPTQPPPGEPPEIELPVPIKAPDDVVPIVSENEIWAPSHDWVPAPSDRESEEEVPFPGPSIKSEGWAGESEGYPDPDEGGGCIFLPPGRNVPSAGQDSGARNTWLLLHPEVSLGFGFPGLEGPGRLLDGWAMQLADGDLDFSAVDAAGESVQGRSVNIQGDLSVAGKLSVDGMIDPTGLQLDPQAANPGNSTTLWTAGSTPRWGEGVIALMSNVGLIARVVSYEGSGETGNTVTLDGINRAYAIVLMGREDGRQFCVSLPAGSTGAITFKHGAGGNVASFSLDAPSAGAAQSLTIENALADFNTESESYDVLVIGTPA